MTINDDQQFLNEALRQATESDDPKADLGLVLLHYHQAILRAAQQIKACKVCAASIDIAKLKVSAAEIQRQNYGSYQELQRVIKARLSGDTAKLCEECQRQYKADLLAIFAAMHSA